MGGERGVASERKIPGVSSQSDENRLNANEGKLLTVKLNSSQACEKMHSKEDRNPMQHYTDSVQMTHAHACFCGFDFDMLKSSGKYLHTICFNNVKCWKLTVGILAEIRC